MHTFEAQEEVVEEIALKGKSCLVGKFDCGLRHWQEYNQVQVDSRVETNGVSFFPGYGG